MSRKFSRREECRSDFKIFIGKLTRMSRRAWEDSIRINLERMHVKKRNYLFEDCVQVNEKPLS